MKNIKKFFAEHNINIALIIDIIGAMFVTFVMGMCVISAAVYGLHIMIGVLFILAIIAAVWSAINIYTSLED